MCVQYVTSTLKIRSQQAADVVADFHVFCMFSGDS